MSAMRKTLPVYVWSLGCPKNRADTERLLGSLGLPARTVPTPAKARLILINTCAFIEPATRESLAAIFSTIKKLKRLKNRPLLAVCGCLPGRYGITELKSEIPEVDLWLPTATQPQWPSLLDNALGLAHATQPGRLFSSPSYLWLKIAEGCDHRCAFCAIPSIRGRFSSVPKDALLEEAQAALATGIREICLVAQDTTSWGRDLPDGATLRDLTHSLARLPGLAWLRILYLYPAAITPEILDLMGEGGPILPYFDIPFQHSEESILKRMGRPFAVPPGDVIERIRKKIPHAALRATLMTGYPGETDADFQRLCQFVREARFHNLGVFAFQPEEGTKAAELPDQIPAEIAAERRDQLMAMQKEISREILAEYEFERMDVLVDKSLDEEWPGLHAGRVWFQAPEVDGITYISGPDVQPGAFLQAEITDTHAYDLSALA